MGNYFKSKKSGMVGYRVANSEIADKLIKFFKDKESELAWINEDKYGLEVLISESELNRLSLKFSEVTIEMRKNGVEIAWPAIYGDPHFTYL
jgi:hypothetical protein